MWIMETTRCAMWDVYDGKIWKDFSDANKFNLFTKPRKYGFMFDLDWFCPYKHISNFLVRVFLLVVLNLPKHIRFRSENVIICGIIPRFIHEPPTNTFVTPPAKELKKAWNEGFECYSMISKKWNGFILVWSGLDVTYQPAVSYVNFLVRK